ncbi:MAG: exo-alpha-sialidase, partial [Bdellovibrionales bacterium]|nr:exo-alpha-sialidase [Bdellovibrionales bacterium]
NRYLSFPDVVYLPSGKLLCAYRDADIHYPPDVSTTELYLIESTDRGKTWGTRRLFPQTLRDRAIWCWHCPRLSLLSDGRVALVCDLVRPGVGPSSVYVSLSEDEGQTWSTPIDTGAFGIVPDRLIEVGPNDWITTCHYPRPEQPGSRLSQRVYGTVDGGKTWSLRSILAEDDNLDYTETSIVHLGDSELVAYIRENSFLHLPTLVCYSRDGGRSWTKPALHPSHGHRPCAGLLAPDSMLVTYREVSGTPGLVAWLGSPRELGWHPMLKDLAGDAHFHHHMLEINHPGGEWHGVEVPLFPLVNWEQEFRLSVRVARLEGEEKSCVICGAGTLYVLEDKIVFRHQPDVEQPEEWLEPVSYELDTGTPHTYTIGYRARRVTIEVDSQPVGSFEIGPRPGMGQRKLSFGNRFCPARSLVAFRESSGVSQWYSAALEISQPSGERITWEWKAADGVPPNFYQLERMCMIDRETSGDLAEAGYSGWTKIDDTTVYCVDYRRCEAEKPYIVGHQLRVAGC